MSVPQDMAYLLEALCLGLVCKTMQGATKQSPLEGTRTGLCDVVFSENSY